MQAVKIKSIKKIKSAGKRYDITVEDNNNYFANGMLIHNCNARFCFRDDRLWVGSRTGVKAQYVSADGIERNLWWKVAKDIGLEEKFRRLIHPHEGDQEGNVEDLGLGHVNLTGTVVYGEVFGQVQDLKYGVNAGASFRVFDTYNPTLGRYNDWDVTQAIAKGLGLETVPELYRGPWTEDLEVLRNGPSVLYPGHTREGFVVKPLFERYQQIIPGQRHSFTGRIIFKMIGEDYKLRKRK